MTGNDGKRTVEGLVTKAVAMDADGLEVENKDGTEFVLAMKGQMGVGIAQFRSDSAEARALREELVRLSGEIRKSVRVGTRPCGDVRQFRRNGVSDRDCGRVRRDGRSAGKLLDRARGMSGLTRRLGMMA